MEQPGSREGARHVDPRALEDFVRTLVGVRDAFVELDRKGKPHTIWVVPAAGAAERQVRLNVTSALMAGPGIAIEPATLRIASALPESAPRAPSQETTPARTPERPDPVLPGRAVAVTPSSAPAPTAPEPPAMTESAEQGAASPQLVRFDVEAPGPGGIRVIVGVRGGDRSGLGVREGDERPGAAMDLAAHAAADAARSAGISRTAFQLAGVSLTDVGGRAHVVAAVDLWTGSDFAARPGAAAVLASYEEAAARAVLAALSRY